MQQMKKASFTITRKALAFLESQVPDVLSHARSCASVELLPDSAELVYYSAEAAHKHAANLAEYLPLSFGSLIVREVSEEPASALFGRPAPYSLSNYVPCTRADMPQGVQQRATALESLGFTVEHHCHAKGGAHASQVSRNGAVVLGWCYGGALEDFLKGAQAMQRSTHLIRPATSAIALMDELAERAAALQRELAGGHLAGPSARLGAIKELARDAVAPLRNAINSVKIS